MDNAAAWYAQLAKPEWAPPAWVFGPVWGVLYAVIAASFGAVLFHAARGNVPKKTLLPFAINAVANALYSPIQFGLKDNALASVDILVVLATIAWAMAAIWPYRKWIALAQLPYLAWVSFATALQLTITFLNHGA